MGLDHKGVQGQGAGSEVSHDQAPNHISKDPSPGSTVASWACPQQCMQTRIVASWEKPARHPRILSQHLALAGLSDQATTMVLFSGQGWGFQASWTVPRIRPDAQVWKVEEPPAIPSSSIVGTTTDRPAPTRRFTKLLIRSAGVRLNRLNTTVLSYSANRSRSRSAGVGEPLNAGFFALRPDARCSDERVGMASCPFLGTAVPGLSTAKSLHTEDVDSEVTRS